MKKGAGGMRSILDGDDSIVGVRTELQEGVGASGEGERSRGQRRDLVGVVRGVVERGSTRGEGG